MPEPINPLLLKILDSCKAQAPEPLYPKPFSIAENLEREHLDKALDHLRIHGLIKFTDWVAGMGQGYTLTEEGERILQNPMLLDRPMAKPKIGPAMGPQHADSTWERGEAVRNSLLQPINPIVTRVLLIANIGVFALGWYLASQRGISGVYLSGNSGSKQYEDLLDEMGSCYPPAILAGDWWRLLAYAFVHRGALHLILNMYFLFNVGRMVESLYGSWRYVLLYTISSITGGVVVYHTNRAAVGASGALCGLLLAMAVWVYMSRSHFPQEFVSRWQGNIMTNIVLIVFISLMPGVSWEGHLGGAVGGAIVAVGLHMNRFSLGWPRWAGMAIVLLVPVGAFASLGFSYDPIRENSAFVQRFRARHQQMDGELIQFQKDYGKTILDDGPQALGPKTQEALGVIDPLVGKLKSLAAELNALQARSEDLKTFLPYVQRLVDAQLSLAEGFQSALSRPDEWNVAKYEDMARRIHRYGVTRRPLLGEGADWLKAAPAP